MAKPHQSKPVLLLAQPALIADSRNVVRANAASPRGAGSAMPLSGAAGAGASSVVLKDFLLWGMRHAQSGWHVARGAGQALGWMEGARRAAYSYPRDAYEWCKSAHMSTFLLFTPGSAEPNGRFALSVTPRARFRETQFPVIRSGLLDLCWRGRGPGSGPPGWPGRPARPGGESRRRAAATSRPRSRPCAAARSAGRHCRRVRH